MAARQAPEGVIDRLEENCPTQLRYTSIVAPLPSTVPFVGPEAQEQ